MFDPDDLSTNPSAGPAFPDLLAVDAGRRRLLGTALGAAALAFLGRVPVARAASFDAAPGFESVPVAADDAVHVPPGYSAQLLFAWGDPVSDGPAFSPDASQSAEVQALQAGMHHDGMHYFPLPARKGDRARGLLAINHEYTDDGLLHPDGMKTWTAAKVRKAQAAHGVSVIEVRQRADHGWEVVRPSRYGRRITAYTPMRIAGPAAGHARMRTAADPEGRLALGTLNNCANGHTPWGTYLTCEENIQAYFVHASPAPADLARYGITERGFGYRWHEFDERFDVRRHPNEVNRFGWVVEIDPFDPASVPVKRTALGRFSHESATHAVASDGRIVVYMGDDQRNEYLYKFVSRDPYDPQQPERTRDLLDHGTLYVARFEAGGSGQWIALVHGENGLTADHGFGSQAEVLIRTRQAGDRVGATMMDRPEWIAVHPVTGEVYCTLTNNNRRGGATANAADGTTPLAGAQPPVDGANPRANNAFGHIVRWREAGGDAAATSFEWDVFVQCGDPALADAAKRGDIRGDAFGNPDGLAFDAYGRLWIATDISPTSLNKGDFAGLGNNALLCADPVSGEVRRFLTGPRGSEITGPCFSPDGRTLFVNIQHPGENPGERNDPDRPKAISAWPDGAAGSRPRSATLAIRRTDGGVVGT